MVNVRCDAKYTMEGENVTGRVEGDGIGQRLFFYNVVDVAMPIACHKQPNY